MKKIIRILLIAKAALYTAIFDVLAFICWYDPEIKDTSLKYTIAGVAAGLSAAWAIPAYKSFKGAQK